MSLQDLRTFFMWCTIINAGLLVVSFLMTALAGGWIHRMHSRWFPISREAWNVTMYALLGGYKTVVVAFNLVPYLALLIVG